MITDGASSWARGVGSETVRIAAVQVVVASALAIALRELPQVGVALALSVASLVLARWAAGSTASGSAEGISTLLFGLLANMVAVGFSARLLLLPGGGFFDSLRFWTLEWAFFSLAGVTGGALALRTVMRGGRWWKLLGVVGFCVSVLPGYTSHLVFLWAIRTRGLLDIW